MSVLCDGGSDNVHRSLSSGDCWGSLQVLMTLIKNKQQLTDRFGMKDGLMDESMDGWVDMTNLIGFLFLRGDTKCIYLLLLHSRVTYQMSLISGDSPCLGWPVLG